MEHVAPKVVDKTDEQQFVVKRTKAVRQLINYTDVRIACMGMSDYGYNKFLLQEWDSFYGYIIKLYNKTKADQFMTVSRKNYYKFLFYMDFASRHCLEEPAGHMEFLKSAARFFQISNSKFGEKDSNMMYKIAFGR